MTAAARGAAGVADVGATTELLAWLRRHRGLRRRRLGKAAYGVYLVALLAALYGIPLFRSLNVTLGDAALRSDVGPVVTGSLVPALGGLFVVALVAFVRNARWRGPVVLPLADVTWLLARPVDRRRVLRPRFAVALAIAAVGGAATGLLGAAMLRSLRPATGPEQFAVAASGFALVAMLGVSLALLVEGSARAERLVQRWSGLGLAIGALLMIGAVVLATDAAAASAGGAHHPADDVIAWSGPWGWSAYAIAASARSGRVGAGVLAALAALMVATVVAATSAFRACGEISTRRLRARASTAQVLGAAVFLGDVRQARLSIRATRARAGRARRRLRPPRSQHLVVIWRDALGCLRAPAQLGWAAAFAAASIGALAVGSAATTARRPPVVVIIGAVLAGYAAAASMVECARLDADQPQVASQLPLRFSGVAVRHVVVPAVLLAAIGALGWLGAVALDVGLPVAGVVIVVLCVPVLVVAALFNAYRGRTPIEWLLSGFGDAGGVLLAGWYLVGPIVALAVLTPTIVVAFDAAGRHAGLGPIVGNVAAVSVVATALGLRAVAARARRRVAPPREGGLLGS